MNVRNVLIIAAVAVGIWWVFGKKKTAELPDKEEFSGVVVPKGSVLTVTGERNKNYILSRASTLYRGTESGAADRNSNA